LLTLSPLTKSHGMLSQESLLAHSMQLA
jgi:hypothetical protein